MRLVAACASTLVLAACSQTDSKDLRTSGIVADIRVNASADGADGIDVTARLSTGGLNSVELSGDDALAVSAGGRTRTLQHREAFSQDDYRTHLDLDGPAGAGVPVSVGLRRGANDESAPKSMVRLPAALVVTAPAVGSTHRRSADLIIGTNVGNGVLAVAWKGSCVQPGSLSADEGEPLIIPADQIRVSSPATAASGSSTPPTSCAVTLSVTRTVTGELDDHYKDGSIRAVRTAAVAIESVP